jgi:serine/threonine-protein kinase
MPDTKSIDALSRESTLEEAMERYADGDASALPAVYDGVVPRIRIYAGRQLDDACVELVVEEVMTALHRHRGDYVPGAPVLPWAFSFARAAMKALLETKAAIEEDAEVATFTSPLRDQLKRLPEPLRSSLELVWLEEFTVREAAALLGTSARIVQARTQRAFQMLESLNREIDETDENEPEPARLRTRGDADPELSDTLVGERYRVGAELGHGGMAVVYDAEDIQQSRRVAIKVLVDARDATEAERFGNEFRVLHALRDHPHIVKVYEEGELPDGQMFYVMERLRGSTLKDVLKDEGRLPWPRVARLVKQACAALEAVHARGLVHRDVKPGNLFVLHDDDGREVVKLIDFGIARSAVADVQLDQLTRPGAIPGTYAYVAPERTHSHNADVRSDIYSLGITMFELLTGRRPFWVPGGDVLELAASLTKPPPSLRKVCAAARVTEQIEAIVQRAIERDPARRFQSADELARAISALDAEGNGRLSFATRNQARRSERVRATLVGASAAMTIGSLTIAALLKGGEDDRLPRVGPELGPEHVEAGLTSISEILGRCRTPDQDAPTRPMRVTFKVLGATGEVIEAKAHGDGSSPQRDRCVEDALYRARFGTFDAPTQIVERDL